MVSLIIFLSPMKFLRSVILITLMITFCFQQWVVILVFNCNQKYIAENLCVNRKKPHSCCQGKCCLNKALQKNTDNSTEAKAPIKYKVETFVDKYDAISFNRTFIVIENSLSPKKQQFHPQNYLSSSFHPPDLFV